MHHPVGRWHPQRVAISGSREGHPEVERWMKQWWIKHGPCTFVLGGARGVDAQARELCDVHGLPYVELPALWTKHGRAAGMMRNREMLEWSGPDGPLLAFSLGGPGTEGCISLFASHRRQTFVCRALEPTSYRRQ